MYIPDYLATVVTDVVVMVILMLQVPDACIDVMLMTKTF